jgi:hypothetical protein
MRLVSWLILHWISASGGDWGPHQRGDKEGSISSDNLQGHCNRISGPRPRQPSQSGRRRGWHWHCEAHKHSWKCRFQGSDTYSFISIIVWIFIYHKASQNREACTLKPSVPQDMAKRSPRRCGCGTRHYWFHSHADSGCKDAMVLDSPDVTYVTWQ